jgi:N-acetylmuramoyl-L-alanine amidase
LQADWIIILFWNGSTSLFIIVFGSATEFDSYHRRRGGLENGLGYHFVIGNGSGTPDGEIEISNRKLDLLDGAHAGVEEYNHYGI